MPDYETLTRYPAGTEREPKRQPEITQQLIEMHSAVNILESLTHNVYERLTAVMHPPIPTNSDKVEKLPESQMGQELSLLTSQIISCHGVLTEIMNRLEI